MFCQCISLCFTPVAPKASKSTLSPDPATSNKGKPMTSSNKELYAQASKISIEDVICIKNTFPTTFSKKIVKINNIINKSISVKPKIKMTIEGPSRRQVIVLMSKINAKIIGSNTSFHIKFINRCLKEINSNTSADFICMEKVSIIVTTNQAVSVQDIGIIEKILKEAENIDQDLIDSS